MTNDANDKTTRSHPRIGAVGEMQLALARAVGAAAHAAVAGGRLPAGVPEVLDSLGDGHVEVPKDSGHGDFATTACLRLAGPSRMPPRKVAEEILGCLDLSRLPVEKTEIAGPGFLNFFLAPRWLNPVVGRIRTEGRDYGRSELGQGAPVQVEFVSANPTGPLGVVNARAATVGDVLAALLSACGFAAQREYYINDDGGQIERLGGSVEARWLQLQGKQAEIPEGGYVGDYIIDIAKAYEAEHPDAARSLPPGDRAVAMGRFAAKAMTASHRRRLSEFGVDFDVWYSQHENITQAACDETLAVLEGGGLVFRQDDAVWLRTTDLGDDKDRVLITREGRATYFLADIAYHRDKFARGFTRVIDLWGPDHHGHIRRMKAAMTALGLDPEALEILIVQWVRLVEGGELARMSKRRGQIVPMEDLIDEVGVDAARFFFLLRSLDSHLDFDLDLARLQTSDNPVYYVQYAHARICSILRQPEAEDDMVALGEPGAAEPDPAAHLDLLVEPAELALIRRLADLPEEIAGAALAREPHRIPRYAMDVATAFHKFYDSCRVLTDEPALRRARLALGDATRIVLANTLGLCGVSAPEKM